MFNNLAEEIKNLNADVKTVANCERAKKLRKKLLCIGLPLAIIGGVGLITCFILFATAGFSAFGNGGFTPRVLIPFALFIPFAILMAVGVAITNLGLKIIITQYTTNLIDETVGNNCSKCGDKIEPSEVFCSKCGTPVKKQCKKCQHINNIKNKYCEKCGEKL